MVEQVLSSSARKCYTKKFHEPVGLDIAATGAV